jgi:N-acetylglucosaminyl-diphospho-decaprenol L-rhamnosyltransferase
MNSPINNDQEITAFIEGCSVLVVIVSYRTGELVIDTLKSLTVELSEQPQMRVVVVDNTCGSDSKIIETAINDNKWQNWVKVKVSPKNGGFSYGNNLAIGPALKAKSSPDYIWLLNPDTQISPGAGLSLFNFLDKNEKVGIAGSCLINHDGAEWGVAFRFPTIISEIEQALQFGPFSRLVKNYVVAQKMGNDPCQVGWLPGASMMIRSKVFNKTGLFDEDYFLYYEETDFCLNAKSKGWTSWYIPSSKVMHIAGQSTGATGENATSKRLPQYMFDSRCHYFTKNHGFLYAIVADIARVCGLLCNKVINVFRGKPNTHNPKLLRDSILNFSIFKYLRRVFKK